jgi:hypothetical protein
MYKINSEVFHKLELSMPEIFTREEASRLTGRLVTPNTLRNLDSTKKGPSGSFKAGKKVMYEKTQFLNWLRTYCSRQSVKYPSFNKHTYTQTKQHNYQQSAQHNYQQSAQHSYQQLDQNYYQPYEASNFISLVMD